MKLTIYRWLEYGFDWLEEFAGEMRMRVSYCGACGEKRDGPACVGRILSYKAVR